MFALAALLCFFADLLGATLFKGHGLVSLGLAFLALHFVWSVALPFGTRR